MYILRHTNQSITVRDVDISVDDVTRLRQALGKVEQGNLDTTAVVESSSDSHSAREGSSAVVDDNDFAEDVRLVFAGKDLREGQPLRRYGIGPESTVHALGRLRGGAQLGKVVKGRSQVRERYISACFYPWIYLALGILRIATRLRSSVGSDIRAGVSLAMYGRRPNNRRITRIEFKMARGAREETREGRGGEGGGASP